MKKIICALLVLLTVTSCRSYEVTNNSYDSSKEIVILYSFVVPERDKNVDSIYSTISNIKKSILKETPNVTLIEAGKGAYIDQMNEIGYNYSCFGINDIDSLESVYENTKKAKFKYLLCSASYSGQEKDYFKNTTPYEVVNYDGIKVGYVGVVSPIDLELQLLLYTDGEDKLVNLYNETEEVFYDTVQCSIDKAKDKGADYIVLISCCAGGQIFLEGLIANLSDVDIVMNEGYYMINEVSFLKNKDNKNVLIISNDYNYSRCGKVTIRDGIFDHKSIQYFE